MPEALFPYQEIGAQWLTTKKYALLADEMGLGKTAQAIRASDLVQASKILVLCPAIARLNWIREFKKFSMRSLNGVAVMTASKNGNSYASPIVVCSYDLLLKNSVFSGIKFIKWDALILDEVHYLKNRKAKRTQAAFGHLIAQADRVYALSGTPAPNHAGELYPLLKAFGVWTHDYWSFVRRYCILEHTVFGTQIKGSQRIPELRRLLAPITLRRKKEDVLQDLPPILYSDVVVEAGPVDVHRWYPELCIRPIENLERDLQEQRAAIEAVVNLTGLGADGLTALGGLQTKCSMSRRYTGLQKTAAVADIIKGELESRAYDKIVIFAWHRDVMVDLFERLRDFHPVLLYGGTPDLKRDVMINKFQKTSHCRVFIGNIKAAGTAITLHAAHHVAFVEASWVPADNAQAAMRVHRIGQTKPVTVRFFSVADTWDEKVQKVLKRKTKDITAIFDKEVVKDEPVVDPFAE